MCLDKTVAPVRPFFYWSPYSFVSLLNLTLVLQCGAPQHMNSSQAWFLCVCVGYPAEGALVLIEYYYEFKALTVN